MISLAYSSQTNARVCMEKLYVMKQSYQLKKDCLPTDTDSINCNDLKNTCMCIFSLVKALT